MTDFVTGGRELDKQLEQLVTREVPRILKSGVAASVGIFADRIRAYAPPGRRGTIAKSVGKRIVGGRNGDEVTGKAGVNVASRSAGGRAFGAHSHLVALGTAPRWTDRGAFRGSMPENDFVLRAFASATSPALAVLQARTFELLRPFE